MEWYQPNIIWDAQVGSDEDGNKDFIMYYVQVEYIAKRPNDPSIKYYMRTSKWTTDKNEISDYLKEVTMKYGYIRQAWVTEYDILATRHKIFSEPNNIS